MGDTRVELRTKRGDYMSVAVGENGRTLIVFVHYTEKSRGTWLSILLAALLAAGIATRRNLTDIAILIALFVIVTCITWTIDSRNQKKMIKSARALWRKSLSSMPDSLAKSVALLVLNDEVEDWARQSKRTLLPDLRTIATGQCGTREQQRLYSETDPNSPVCLDTKDNRCWIARARVAVEIEGTLHEYTSCDTTLNHTDDFCGEWATLVPDDDSRPPYTFTDKITNLDKLWTWWNAPGPPAPPLRDRIPLD